MSQRTDAVPGPASSDISDRIDALREAAELVAARFGVAEAGDAPDLVQRSEERLGHGTNHTVVAFAGPTGAGKSTLFNAVVGEELSAAGVRRPTTGVVHAAVFAPSTGDALGTADSLLDWLGVARRHHLSGSAGSATSADLDGLVLLDLPDYDSTVDANRDEVNRLVELVDLFVWIVDPQKYADHILHDGYLRPLATHHEVMAFVLSKADTLGPDQLVACIADFERLLAEDGLPDARVVPSSLPAADAGAALARPVAPDAVMAMLSERISAREAAVARVSADVRKEAMRMGERTGLAEPGTGAALTVGASDVLDRSSRRDLTERLASAAGVDRDAQIVAAQHVLDARLATGWPVTRWVRRLARRPIASVTPARSSAIASAEVGLALRDAGESAARPLGGPWRPAMVDAAVDQGPPMLRTLDAISDGSIGAQRDRPRWWSAVGGLQRVAAAVLAISLVWLVLLAAVDGFFRIDVGSMTPSVDLPALGPLDLGDPPLPTVAAFAAALFGVLCAAVSAAAAGIGGRRRGARHRRRVVSDIADTVDETIAPALGAVVEDGQRLQALLEAAQGR